MGPPFYAYLKLDVTDWFPYLFTFVNRETADEWWRMISTPPSPYAANVDRISPHFYFQNNSRNYDVAYFLTNTAFPDAQQFRKKIFVSLLDNTHKTFPVTVPLTTVTDHISGRWYFIRSKADPWSHWYLRTHGACLVCGDASCHAIHVSSGHRTKFCIQVRNQANDVQDFVMIERDDISITTPRGHTVHTNDVGDLVATEDYQGEMDLRFGDLKKRLITRGEKQVNGEIWEYVEAVGSGLGEAWELVD